MAEKRILGKGRGWNFSISVMLSIYNDVMNGLHRQWHREALYGAKEVIMAIVKRPLWRHRQKIGSQR